jgi:t-SNARE complex subunit (syntaxin)
MHQIFGLTISEWTGVLTVLGALISAGSWLFKKIALDPLRADIRALSDQIQQQLRVHEQSLSAVNQRLTSHDKELGSHSTRITHLEDRVGIDRPVEQKGQD